MKLSAIGDVIHALPVLDTLRTLRPGIRVTWACHRLASGILEGHPQLEDLIVLPRRSRDAKGLGGWRQVMARLRSRPWAVAFDLQGLAKSGLASLMSGARLRVGLGGQASREGNRFFMNKTGPIPGPQENIVSINRNILTTVGLDPHQVPARAVIPDREIDRESMAAWARSTGIDTERFLILDPFAGWVTKIWSLEKWGEFARQAQQRTGLRVMLFYGPAEKIHAEKMAGELRRDYGVEGLLAPPTTLGQAAALLRLHGQAFVGGDTGPSHMAAALGLPTVQVFGPSCELRNAPLFAGVRLRTLQDRTHPCTGTYRRECPLHAQPGHCMDRTSPDQVFTALNEVMDQDRVTA